MYQSATMYNLTMKMLHRGFKDYEIITDMIEGDSCLDLACATCLITPYLPKNISYEGWDLNKKFVHYSKKKGINIKKKNIFEIKNEKNKWDTIIIKDLLHHVYPKDKELLNMARNNSRNIIICEPILEKPRLKDILFKPKIFNFVHKYFGDYDNTNGFYSGRLFQEAYNKSSFLNMLKEFGKIEDVKQNKEMVIVKIKTK